MVKTIFDNSTSVNPYFSIIIPMFNAEKYIRWCKEQNNKFIHIV